MPAQFCYSELLKNLKTFLHNKHPYHSSSSSSGRRTIITATLIISYVLYGMVWHSTVRTKFIFTTENFFSSAKTTKETTRNIAVVFAVSVLNLSVWVPLISGFFDVVVVVFFLLLTFYWSNSNQMETTNQTYCKAQLHIVFIQFNYTNSIYIYIYIYIYILYL